jgi:molybdopterin-guanine dinucleotide biosynthesis protein A
MAATRNPDSSIQSQPVFCLLRASLFERLAQDLRAGASQVERWIKQQAHATVVFEDARHFTS